MNLVTQSPHRDACQHACLAMLAGVPLSDVIEIVGHANRMDIGDRQRAAKALGVEIPNSGFILAAFPIDPNRSLAALMREHRTLWCSVYDVANPNFAHAVIVHDGKLYDPHAGINPVWPWSRVIGQATPASTRDAAKGAADAE